MSLETWDDRLARRGSTELPTAARFAPFAALFLAALVPVLTTPIPAMVDYVNHLARMYAIVADGTPHASPYYHVTWRLYPNLAMDLIVPQIARVMNVELATRLFLLVSQILVVTGAAAIEYAVKRRFEIAGYVALLVLSSVPFAWGFLNFEFALGVALWGIAGWLVVRERRWAIRAAFHTLVVASLFASHLFALGLYGVTLGLHELWSAWTRRSPWRQLALTLATLAAPALAAGALMLATGGSVGRSVNTWDLLLKPLWVFMVLNGYSAVFSIVGTSILAVLVYALARARAVRFESSGAWLLAGLAVLYVLVPARLLDTAFVDIRVLVGALLIVPAFVSITYPNPRWRIVSVAIVGGITLASIAITGWVWWSYDPTYREMIGSFDRIDRNARVLVGHSGTGNDPPMLHLADYPLYHAPTLAVHYAGAFVPTLFTTVGKQPIAVAADFQRLAYSCGGPVPLSDLRDVVADRATAETPLFVRTWTRDFDFVYLLGPQVADPLPGVLDLVETHAAFSLYKVRKAAHVLGRNAP